MLFCKRLKHLILNLLVPVTFMLSFTVVRAQDFEYGTLTAQDTLSTYSGISLAAGGIVLDEFGSFTYKTEWPYKRTRLYHAKIKLLKASAFTYGQIAIPYYQWATNKKEEIEYLETVIYTPLGNGKYQKSIPDMSGVFHTTQNKGYNILKYAFPNLTEGCIIEYRYSLETPDATYEPWIFQGSLPKLHSEYWVHMPAALNCKVSLKGQVPLSKNLISDQKCPTHNINKCRQFVYAMNSVPALIPEPNMAAVKNYVSALYFAPVIYSTYEQRNGFLIAPDNWKLVDEFYRDNENYGGQLKKTAFFKNELQGRVADSPDTLAKAHAIYRYICNHVKFKTPEKAGDTNIEKAFNNGQGDVADINLILITALRAYGIDANPVLLATKNHGEIDKQVPSRRSFNYLIGQAKIGNKLYFLDASDPLLPFGVLPAFCFNDAWRVISKKDSCYWLPDLPVQKANTNHIIDLSLQSNGNITGSVKTYYYGYAAYQKRKSVKDSGEIDGYTHKLKQRLRGIKISNIKLEGLDSLDAPLRETYEAEIPASKQAASNGIAFNPYIFDLINDNPYKLNERVYPVDCGPPSEERFTLTLHLPEQYDLEAPPAQSALKLPQNGGMFMSTFNYLNDATIFSHIIQLNRSVYLPAEYPFLKELYNKIIQAQKADIILKKKS